MATTTLRQPASVAERATRNTSLDTFRRVLRVRLAPLALTILGTFRLFRRKWGPWQG